MDAMSEAREPRAVEGSENPDRDYLAEAYRIIKGESLLLPERAHLVALYDVTARLVNNEALLMSLRRGEAA